MKEGWEYKKLIDVCDFQGGSQPPKSEWINHDSPGYIRMLQIRDFTQSRKVSPEYVKLTNRTKCCFSDDILIGRYGASLGKILTGIAGAYNVAIMRTIPNETLLSKGYLKYYLMSSIFQSFLFNIGGRAAQAGFNKEDLKCLNIPITTLDEQRRIVSYLDSSFKLIDEIKNKALKSLTEAKALFQSALAEAMEPKEGWEEKTLGEIATEMYRGSGIKRDQITPIGFPCLRYGEIYTTYNYSFSECISHTNESIISPKKYFEKGDILFAITGESVEDIGKCIAYTGKEKCLLGGDIVAMKHNQYPQFLAYALSTKEAIRQKGLGKVKLKVVHTNIPALKTIRIYLPNLSTQKQIVSHLDKLSSKVRAIEEKYQKMVEECDALKQAMLRDVFE